MVVVVVTVVVICLCRRANARLRHKGVSGTSSLPDASGGKAFSNQAYDDYVEPTVSGNFFPCASNKGHSPHLQKKNQQNNKRKFDYILQNILNPYEHLGSYMHDYESLDVVARKS